MSVDNQHLCFLHHKHSQQESGPFAVPRGLFPFVRETIANLKVPLPMPFTSSHRRSIDLPLRRSLSLLTASGPQQTRKVLPPTPPTVSQDSTDLFVELLRRRGTPKYCTSLAWDQFLSNCISFSSNHEMKADMRGQTTKASGRLCRCQLIRLFSRDYETFCHTEYLVDSLEATTLRDDFVAYTFISKQIFSQLLSSFDRGALPCVKQDDA